MISKTYYPEPDQESVSRYRRTKHLVSSDNWVRLETQDAINVPESPGDTYFTVTPKYEHRLDLVAYKFYNNPLLWWAIALASGIRDPFTIPSGTTLRVPPVTTIFSLRGVF